MTQEDEEFNRIEMESRLRKEAVLQALHNENERLGLYKGVYESEEEMRKPIGLTAPYRQEDDDDIQEYKKPWVGLTDEDVAEVERWVEFKEEGSGRIPTMKLVRYIEVKLRSKNA